MDPARLLRRLERGNVANVRFADMRRLLEAVGYEERRASGSHHIFVHPRTAQIVNLQDVDGQAKPYQVRQCLRLIQRYALRLEG